VVADENGNLVILDWDECGIGNRYQDLGFGYYTIFKKGLAPSCYDTFIESYADDSVDESVVKSVAGLVSLAYASYYDFDRSMEFGKNLLTESHWEK